MKKTISILLALAIMGGVIAGCSSEAAPAEGGTTTTAGDAGAKTDASAE